MKNLSNENLWKYSEFFENKNYSFDKNQILDLLSKKDNLLIFKLPKETKSFISCLRMSMSTLELTLKKS